MRHDATPGRRLPFGSPPPFVPTHDADRVAEALRGHMPPAELAELARQLRKAVKRRNRSGKDSTHLAYLLRLVDRASRPPALEGPIEVFAQPVGGDPLEVVLLSGPNIGDRVTQVPAGAKFAVPDHDGQLFLRPAGETGPDGMVLTGMRGATVKITEDRTGGVVLQATSTAGETPQPRECRFCHETVTRTRADALDHETWCSSRPGARMFDVTDADVRVGDVDFATGRVHISGRAPLKCLESATPDLVPITRGPIDGDVLFGSTLAGYWLVIAWQHRPGGRWWVSASTLADNTPNLDETVALAATRRGDMAAAGAQGGQC